MMEKQLVVFELGKEQFGFEIAAIEGIVKMQEITRIPFAPNYVEGITNLRGSVLPVIDLRKRLGFASNEETLNARIITVNIHSKKTGLIVTSVTEILTIDDDVIETPQKMMNNVDVEYITGVAKVDNRLIILLDLSKILSTDVEETMNENK
jgi:purine-binding chemotaxis protein CheW